MSELFTNPQYMVALLITGAILVVALVSFMVYQQLRINRLQEAARPRYGFLGKPLMSFMAFAFVAVGGGALFVLTSNTNGPQGTSATNQLEVRIETEVVSKAEGLVTVKFNAVPVLNGRDWADGYETYDVYWYVSGETDFTRVEVKLSELNQGGFTYQLAAGTYLVKVEALGTDVSGEKIVELEF
jgi:hypothetical protein